MRKEMASVLRRTLISCTTQVRASAQAPEIDEKPESFRKVADLLSQAVLEMEQIELQKGKAVR